jgi:S1-C subfamily serine protease
MNAIRFVMSTFRNVALLVVAGILIGGFVAEKTRNTVHAQAPSRALPDDNLAYPVLISLKNGGGSGFYLNTKTAVYLVTAKHVLFDPNTGKILDTSFDLLSYSKDLSDPTPNSFTVDTAVLGLDNIIRHPSEDIAIMKVASLDDDKLHMSHPLPGIAVHTSAKAGVVGVGLDTIRKFNDVLIGNEAIIMGYPTSLGLQTMPQIDPRRPLLRKGIVAGLTPRTHSIILDCPVYFGNSGGPVLEIDHTGLGQYIVRIVGVVSQYVPYADGGKTFLIMANSGYSVVTPMDYVLEMIK